MTTTEADTPAVTVVTRLDDYSTYTYPPTGEELDSVTTVIAATNSKPWIARWYGSSSMAWAVDNIDLLRAVLAGEHVTEEQAAKGLEPRTAAINLGKDAAQRLRETKADAGTFVHDVQEALILWAASPGRTGADVALPTLPEHLADSLYDGEPLVDVVEFMVDGFINWVSAMNPRFLATEMAVFNQPLGIAGTLDAIAELDGYGLAPDYSEVIAQPGGLLTPCIDTKTGKNPEGTWKEQLAAYRRMPECLLPLGQLHPMPRTDCGMVLHLRPEYPDGWLLHLVAGPDDEAAWERFESAARIYRDRKVIKAKPGKSVRALRADGTMPGPRLCDLASEGYGRALAPLREALGAGCELEDLAKFTAAEVLAVRRIGPKLIETIRTMLADHGLTLSGEELLPVLQAVRASAGPEVH